MLSFLSMTSSQNLSEAIPSPSRLGKAVSIVLLVLIIAAIGGIVYLAGQPPRERFTEFYLLDHAGRATDYPEVLTVGQQTRVTMGIVNREQVDTNYAVAVVAGSAVLLKLNPVALVNDQKYEETVTFALNAPGNGQKVEFRLFKDGGAEPYLTLYLLIDVLPRS